MQRNGFRKWLQWNRGFEVSKKRQENETILSSTAKTAKSTFSINIHPSAHPVITVCDEITDNSALQTSRLS